jgi:nitroreductase
MNAIFARRSVRNYTDRPVSREDLHDLLRAA